MGIGRCFLLIAGLSLAGCMLPPPVDDKAYTSKCSEKDTPPQSGLLFYSTRLSDCRRGPTRMSWHRAVQEQYRQGIWSPNDIQLLKTEAWNKALDDQINPASTSIPTILYIHGFNNDHDEALQRAGAIRDVIGGKRTVVAFTWPSYASKRKYFWDEVNAEWTGVKAMELLERLTSKGRKVIIIAHSMGNRIALDVVRSWPLRHPGQPIPVERLIMASPDVDRAWFVQQAGAGFPISITLYGSTHDQPLSASWRSHGYPRAGDFSKRVTGNDLDPDYPAKQAPAVQFVDTSPVRTGRMKHSDFIDSPKGAIDLCRVVTDNNKAGAGRSVIVENHFYRLEKDHQPIGDDCESWVARAISLRK